jgi:hypothetical protein
MNIPWKTLVSAAALSAVCAPVAAPAAAGAAEPAKVVTRSQDFTLPGESVRNLWLQCPAGTYLVSQNLDAKHAVPRGVTLKEHDAIGYLWQYDARAQPSDGTYLAAAVQGNLKNMYPVQDPRTVTVTIHCTADSSLGYQFWEH